MVQQIVLPIKDSSVLKMVQDTLLDSFRAGRRNYTVFQLGRQREKIASQKTVLRYEQHLPSRLSDFK